MARFAGCPSIRGRFGRRAVRSLFDVLLRHVRHTAGNRHESIAQRRLRRCRDGIGRLVHGLLAAAGQFGALHGAIDFANSRGRNSLWSIGQARNWLALWQVERRPTKPSWAIAIR